MKHGFLGSGVALLASTGLALAQYAAPLPDGGAAARPARVAAVSPTAQDTTPPQPIDQVPPSAVPGDRQALPAGPVLPPAPAAAVLPPPADHGPGPHPVLGPAEAGAVLGGPYDFCSRCWVTAEYLLWEMRKGPVPFRLVTTGPLNGITTGTLLGDTKLDYKDFSGIRLTAGTWFDAHGAIGGELRGFLFERRNAGAAFASNGLGLPELGIPFVNAITGQPDFADVATPFQTVGRVAVTSSSRLWGAEGNFLFNLFRNCSWGVDTLVGFRYADLREDLRIDTSTAPLPSFNVAFNSDVFAPPFLTTTSDRFGVHNEFYGGQIGGRVECRHALWFFDVGGKIAFGATHQVLNINGNSSLQSGPVVVQTLPGGILALASNIGHTSRSDFAVIPELELRLGYQFSPHLNVFVGYDLLYWSHVARPGDQINPVLNPALVPTFMEYNPALGPRQPEPVLRSTDFWAQGVNFGLELRY